MDGVMLAFDPMSLMELQWGPDTVRIELEPVSSGTLLRLLAVLEDRGKGARDGAGWHACLAHSPPISTARRLSRLVAPWTGGRMSAITTSTHSVRKRRRSARLKASSRGVGWRCASRPWTPAPTPAQTPKATEAGTVVADGERALLSPRRVLHAARAA